MAEYSVGGSIRYHNCETCTEKPLDKTPQKCSRNNEKWEFFKSRSQNGIVDNDLDCPNYESIPIPSPIQKTVSNEYRPV